MATWTMEDLLEELNTVDLGGSEPKDVRIEIKLVGHVRAYGASYNDWKIDEARDDQGRLQKIFLMPNAE